MRSPGSRICSEKRQQNEQTKVWTGGHDFSDLCKVGQEDKMKAKRIWISLLAQRCEFAAGFTSQRG